MVSGKGRFSKEFEKAPKRVNKSRTIKGARFLGCGEYFLSKEKEFGIQTSMWNR